MSQAACEEVRGARFVARHAGALLVVETQLVAPERRCRRRTRARKGRPQRPWPSARGRRARSTSWPRSSTPTPPLLARVAAEPPPSPGRATPRPSAKSVPSSAHAATSPLAAAGVVQAERPGECLGAARFGAGSRVDCSIASGMIAAPSAVTTVMVRVTREARCLPQPPQTSRASNGSAHTSRHGLPQSGALFATHSPMRSDFVRLCWRAFLAVAAGSDGRALRLGSQGAAGIIPSLCKLGGGEKKLAFGAGATSFAFDWDRDHYSGGLRAGSVSRRRRRVRREDEQRRPAPRLAGRHRADPRVERLPALRHTSDGSAVAWEETAGKSVYVHALDANAAPTGSGASVAATESIQARPCSRTRPGATSP